MKIPHNRRLDELPAYPFAGLPAIKRRLIEAGVDLIDLGVGDSDAPPASGCIEALHSALQLTPMHKYGFQQGLPAFREAASRWMERRFQQRFDPATELLPLIGSKDGLVHLPLALCNPGDLVVIPEPGYQAYRGGAVLADAEPVVVPLRAESGFLLELDGLPVETLRRTKLVVVNYPNNPTAAIAPRDYLERLVATCRAHDIVLAYDNAYVDLTFDGYVAPSIFEIAGAREVAIEFFSMSKSYRMTGWRLAFAVGRSELIGALAAVKTWIDTGPFLAVQAAGAWTLDHSEALLPPFITELTERRDAAVNALGRAGFEVAAPLGAMYLWVPLPAGLSSADFAASALAEDGVVVVPGSTYGPAGEGFFRVALTVPGPRLEAACVRLGQTLSRCQAGVVPV